MKKKIPYVLFFLYAILFSGCADSLNDYFNFKKPNNISVIKVLYISEHGKVPESFIVEKGYAVTKNTWIRTIWGGDPIEHVKLTGDPGWYNEYSAGLTKDQITKIEKVKNGF